MVPPVIIISNAPEHSQVLKQTKAEFDKENIESEIYTISKQLDTDVLYHVLDQTKECKIYIVLTSISISLPSMVASTVTQPVIAVPVTAATSDVVSSEELISIGHLPEGLPLASVGINGGRNAAKFAIRILASFSE